MHKYDCNFKLIKKLHISPQQMECVTNSGQGEGLIKYGGIVLPFTDMFPTNTIMYKLMTTKLLEQGLLHKLANQRFRVVGDVPKLSDMQPEGTLGKAALRTAKSGSFVIKKTGSALLTAESAGIKFNNYLRQKDKDKQQKILSNEQFQIRFTRRPNDKGKYKTYINFTRGKNNFKLQHKGIVHRLANN